MACINYEEDQEEAHYHFAISELVYYISQYGIDNVMTDIYDYMEVEKKLYENGLSKELNFED